MWILGTISGIILFYGISFVGVFGSGYGTSSGCVSYGGNPSPCTPTLQQVTINPLAGSARFFLGFIIPLLLLAILIGLPAWIGGPILAQRRGSSSRTAILVVSIIASALAVKQNWLRCSALASRHCWLPCSWVCPRGSWRSRRPRAASCGAGLSSSCSSRPSPPCSTASSAQAHRHTHPPGRLRHPWPHHRRSQKLHDGRHV